jgi:hypothetical protein
VARASPAARGAAATIAALAVAAASNALLQTMVVPAIGVLARDLDASPTAATWVLTAFICGDVDTCGAARRCEPPAHRW